MPINVRRKGHNYERRIAAWYRSLGYDARRGQQGDGGSGVPDVRLAGLPLHIECKHHARLGLAQRAYEQARRDCKVGDIPVAHVRGDGGPDLVVVGLENWAEIVGKAFGEAVE